MTTSTRAGAHTRARARASGLDKPRHIGRMMAGMSPDRTGDADPAEVPPHKCRNGWATPPDSDHPRRCPLCPRPPAPSPGYPVLSAKAAAAIARADAADAAEAAARRRAREAG